MRVSLVVVRERICWTVKVIYCGVCGKQFTPDAFEVLGDVVVGKKSMGISLMSLVAYLKIVCRIRSGFDKAVVEFALWFESLKR